MQQRHGEYKIPGGKLVQVDLHVRDGRLADVQVSGDFFLEPAEAIDGVNAALEGVSADTEAAALSARVNAALSGDVAMFGLTADGVAVAVQRALQSGHAS